MAQAHVVAGIDSSYLNQSVADYAAWIASTVGVPLTLLHNIEHSEPPATSDLTGSIGLGSREHLLEELIELEARRNRLLVEQGKALLEDAEHRVISQGVNLCHKEQRHGSLTETLIDLEDTIRVLVLGVRGEEHSKSDTALGHQIEAIIRALHKPVLVVNGDFVKPQRLMLAYDGSEAADRAVDWLATSPLYKNMTCHLVHVCKDVSKGETLLKQASDILDKAGVHSKNTVLTGEPLDALLTFQQTEGIDLIVMGSFGHSRLRELVWGSLTAKMLTQASIPLLLLR